MSERAGQTSGGEPVRFRVRAGDRGVLLGESELVIGRSAYCTLILEQDSISRIHASLRMVGGKVELTDHNSSNGTYVNGRAIQGPTLVGPADEIRLGRVRIWIEVASMRMSVDTGRFPAVRLPEPDEVTDTNIYERDR